MKTIVRIHQNHRHDVTLKMLTYVVYQHLDLFQEESGKNVRITHDFGRIIGKTTCINTANMQNPNIYYDFRGNRKYPSKMINGVEPQDTTCVTLIVRQYKHEIIDNTDYLHVFVVTSYIGTASPKEYTEIEYKRSIGKYDFTPEEEQEAIIFWSHHALLPESA